jgi:acyl-coenzyme A synthetase/AMP-(fatty) acid ligase
MTNNRKAGPTNRIASKFEPDTFRTMPTMLTPGIETKDRVDSHDLDGVSVLRSAGERSVKYKIIISCRG